MDWYGTMGSVCENAVAVVPSARRIDEKEEVQHRFGDALIEVENVSVIPF